VYVADPPAIATAVLAANIVVPDTVVYVLPSLNVTVIDPVPVAEILKFVLVPEHIVADPVMLAVGLGTTLIVADAPVKLAVLDAVVASFVTLTNV
jgi:hypothetical protein